MPTECGIESPQSCDGAPAKREIARVGVVKTNRERTEVEGAASKYAVVEVAFEFRVVGVKLVELFAVEVVKVWCPHRERSYSSLIN